MHSDTKRYIPLLDLKLIHEALEQADRLLRGKNGAVTQALEHYRSICHYKIGELVQYRPMSGDDKDTWVDGVVVAFMVHPPSYICRAGDVRDKDGPDDEKLCACPDEFIRPRGSKRCEPT